jgi:hypothetical protein
MANLKQYTSVSELGEIKRNTTAVLGQNPEGRFGVQLITGSPIYDSERAWVMTCSITGRMFSPIQVPAHFLEVSVCDGKAYKKYMSERLNNPLRVRFRKAAHHSSSCICRCNEVGTSL